MVYGLLAKHISMCIWQKVREPKAIHRLVKLEGLSSEIDLVRVVDYHYCW
jgi:hypothetical protein